MKTFMLSLFFLSFSFTAFAQLPPRIRVPQGTQTDAQKAQAAKDKLYATPGVFKPLTNFTKGEKYYSGDKRYFFTFQEDGNFVVYKTATSKPLWNSHTNGKAVKKCVFQRDGNLVMYDYNRDPIWDAWTDQKNKNGSSIGKGDVFSSSETPLYMTMQDDGNLVIYGPFSKSSQANVIWSSNTFERN